MQQRAWEHSSHAVRMMTHRDCCCCFLPACQREAFCVISRRLPSPSPHTLQHTREMCPHCLACAAMPCMQPKVSANSPGCCDCADAQAIFREVHIREVADCQHTLSCRCGLLQHAEALWVTVRGPAGVVLVVF
jgi:hypothetical protein